MQKLKIYIEGEKPKTVRELLKRLFSHLYINGLAYKSAGTFYDSKCTRIQCYANKFRSFEDVLALVNTYFPTVSYKTLMKILLTLDIKAPTGEICQLYMYNCSQIGAIRMHYSSTSRGYRYTYLRDFIQKYRSKRSWGELLNSIGINSDEALEAMRDKPKK